MPCDWTFPHWVSPESDRSPFPHESYWLTRLTPVGTLLAGRSLLRYVHLLPLPPLQGVFTRCGNHLWNMFTAQSLLYPCPFAIPLRGWCLFPYPWTAAGLETCFEPQDVAEVTSTLWLTEQAQVVCWPLHLSQHSVRPQKQSGPADGSWHTRSSQSPVSTADCGSVSLRMVCNQATANWHTRGRHARQCVYTSCVVF